MLEALPPSSLLSLGSRRLLHTTKAMALLLSTPALRSTSWILKKIRDSCFYDILEPIEDDPSLVFQPNPRGWTCLHVACTSAIPLKWWEWLLQQAQQEHTKLRSLRTDNGQTPIDLFFRRWLFPLPWQDRQIQQDAELLRKAIKMVLQCPQCLAKVRLHILGEDKTWDMTERKARMLEVVCRFWHRMESLLSVAYCGGMDPTYRTKLRDEVVIALASLPWSPEPVADLAMKLFPYSDGPSRPNPLHLWASAESIHECYQRHDEGVTRVMCESYPAAASRASAVGRFPLHVALSFGKRWAEIEPLFYAYPGAVNSIDPVSRLPIFCLPSAVPVDEYEVEMTAKWRGRQASIWYYIPQRDRNRAIDSAREIIELERIDTIYQLLRRYPSALALD